MKIIPPETLLSAYSQGIFPMAETRESEDVDWYLASKRGVIPIDDFHISRNVLRIIKQKKFNIKVNSRFRDVVKACSERDTTWINDLILNSYDVLNQAGHAHSVEIYIGNELVGGLYGVSLKSAFFGESMFKTQPEADKIALYYCHKILSENDFTLWDTQFYTDHLSQFGCIEIEADEYQEKLEAALQKECPFKLVP